MKEQYEANKAAKIGDEIKCPTCEKKFTKILYNTVFCGRGFDTTCKDKFHSAARNQKPERYYPITANSCRRFLLFDGDVMTKQWWAAFLVGTLKQSIVSDKSISYRVENVEIGIGKPEFGASLDLVFILKVEL